MGFLGRLFGSEIPRVPTGGRVFLAMSTDLPPQWTIRYAMAGEDETADRPRVKGAPTFMKMGEAARCLDCVQRGVAYVYPAGPV